MSLSGFSDSRKSNCATTTFETKSSTRPAQKHDPFLEQSRVDVVSPLAPRGLLHDDGDEVERAGLGCSGHVRRSTPGSRHVGLLRHPIHPVDPIPVPGSGHDAAANAGVRGNFTRTAPSCSRVISLPGIQDPVKRARFVGDLHVVQNPLHDLLLEHERSMPDRCVRSE